MTKNILLVISKFPPEYSGPGVRIPKLYDWFKGKNLDYRYSVICNSTEFKHDVEYSHAGMPVTRITANNFAKFFKFLPDRFYKTLVYQIEFLKTYFVLHKKDVDLLHVAGHSGGTAAALYWAKKRNIPVFIELVTEYARPHQKYWFFFKTGLPERSVVMALTEKAKEKSMKSGVQEEKIWCRPNPIDTQKYSYDFNNKKELRSKLTKFDDSKIVVSNVAKIMPQKNQILLIKTLEYLPENYCTVIAGPLVKEGPLYERDIKYFESMKEIIENNNLADRVELITDFVEADQYMKLSNVYAMPAYNEGFGTPMIEAMGCGVPVVANAGEASFQEWINPGENGYLCDIEKPEEWAKAIEKAADISALERQKISANIREKAGQDTIYAQYEALFKDLLDET